MGMVMEMDMSKPPFNYGPQALNAIQKHIFYKNLLTYINVIASHPIAKQIITIITSNYITIKTTIIKQPIYINFIYGISEIFLKLDKYMGKPISSKMHWGLGFIISFIMLRFMLGGNAKKRAEIVSKSNSNSKSAIRR
jgi:hypothetical protein